MPSSAAFSELSLIFSRHHRFVAETNVDPTPSFMDLRTQTRPSAAVQTGESKTLERH